MEIIAKTGIIPVWSVRDDSLLWSVSFLPKLRVLKMGGVWGVGDGKEMGDFI